MIIEKYTAAQDVALFRLKGKLISSSMDKLKAGLDAALAGGAVKVAVNLRGVEVLDSAAVGLLISRSRAAKKAGGALILCEPQPGARALLQLVDAAGALPVWETENEAVASLGKQAEETAAG